MKYFKPVPYEKEFEPIPGVIAKLVDAGLDKIYYPFLRQSMEL